MWNATPWPTWKPTASPIASTPWSAKSWSGPAPNASSCILRLQRRDGRIARSRAATPPQAVLDRLTADNTQELAHESIAELGRVASAKANGGARVAKGAPAKGKAARKGTAAKQTPKGQCEVFGGG